MAAPNIPNMEEGLLSSVRRGLRELIKKEGDSLWNERAVQCCEKVLCLIELGSRSGLFELKKALATKSPQTDCILVAPVENYQRLKVDKTINWPHVASCKLWRWPQLPISMNGIKQVEKYEGDDEDCHGTDATKPYKNICVNPFHYERAVDEAKVKVEATGTQDLSTWHFWYYDTQLRCQMAHKGYPLSRFLKIQDSTQIVARMAYDNSMCPPGSSYNFFKSEFQPIWNNPAKNLGGRFVFLFDSNSVEKDIYDLWNNLLKNFLEKGIWEKETSLINGLKVGKLEKDVHKLSIWTKDEMFQDFKCICRFFDKLAACLPGIYSFKFDPCLTAEMEETSQNAKENRGIQLPSEKRRNVPRSISRSPDEFPNVWKFWFQKAHFDEKKEIDWETEAYATIHSLDLLKPILQHFTLNHPDFQDECQYQFCKKVFGSRDKISLENDAFLAQSLYLPVYTEYEKAQQQWESFVNMLVMDDDGQECGVNVRRFRHESKDYYQISLWTVPSGQTNEFKICGKPLREHVTVEVKECTVYYELHSKRESQNPQTSKDAKRDERASSQIVNAKSLWDPLRKQHPEGKDNSTGRKRTRPSDRPFFFFDQCRKFYKHKGQLDRHRRIHRNEKPSATNDCGKKLRNLHQPKIHQFLPIHKKSFDCNECPKKFRTLSRLKAHKISHTNETTFHCNECYKKFRNPAELKNHQFVHKSEKSFECGNVHYYDPQGLTYYQNVHKNKYECHKCGNKFKGELDLEGHKCTPLDDAL